MTIKHKILLGYIKDLSVETPNPESLISARENISRYSLKLDITSKILKNKMIEVYTKLTYEDKIVWMDAFGLESPTTNTDRCPSGNGTPSRPPNHTT